MMVEIIKTEKQIIEDAFLKKRSFSFQKKEDKDIILFNDPKCDKSLRRKWKLIK